MKRISPLVLVALITPLALGDIVISEWMYSGASGEFVEFTNVGPTSVDMAGWSFDDDSQVPGTVDLSAFGVLAVGQSAILTEAVAVDFAAAWGLATVPIIGANSANLSRNDQVNLFDGGGLLVDQLSFGDQTYPGTPRAQNRSCNIPASDYGFATAQTTWILAGDGDDFGSWVSSGFDVASPGIAPIPEPSTALLIAAGALLTLRRRS